MSRRTCCRRRTALIAIAALVGTGGCAGSTGPSGVAVLAGGQVENPHLVGRVAEVGWSHREQTVLVRDVRVPATGYEAGIALDVGSAPIFVRRADGSLVRGALSDVKAGAELRAWSTGIELRSLPPQWSATRVEVTR